MHRFFAIASFYCATASLIGSAAAQEKITVERAVDLALKGGNLRLLSVEKRATAGHDQARSVGARMLPSIHLSEEYQRWDCPAAISLTNFSAGAQCLATLQAMPKPMLPKMLDGFTTQQTATITGLLGPFLAGPPTVVRFQDTNSFVAAVNQPLLGLLHTGYDFAAQLAAARANDAGVQVSQAATVQAVRTAFLQYFEARALGEIAAASRRELREQVQVSEARLKAGVITNADLLRVVVAEANAQQQQIAAQTQADVVKTQLLDAIGVRSDENVELVEPTTLLTAANAPLPAPAAAKQRADAHRPEVVQARLSDRAAADTRRARYLSLLPEVDAEGAYVRTDGQLFAPKNQWFIGVKASWAIWEWGASFFQARAAAHLAEAAAIDLENQRRTVGVEVQNAIAQSEAAAVSVGVAEKTIASAQEAFRVEQALVNAGTATTTDLLDAQAALTTARLNLARARYELAIQRVALARAMGE
jgi:outer membrane protein TolC